MPLRERDLTGPVASHLMNLGFDVYEEVPIVGRYADLVAVGTDLIAVELKLEDWRGAIRQAMAYQLAADRAYVALPLGRAQEAHRHRFAFEREGVGLLAVDDAGGVRVVLPAAPSPRRLPSLDEALRLRIRSVPETVDTLTGRAETMFPTPATEVPQVRFVDHEAT